MKSSYHFPLKSRAAIAGFICDRPRFRWEGAGRLRLAWNIKVHSFDETGHAGAAASGGDVDLHAHLDGAWAEECESNHELFGWACEGALRQYLDGDWTRYPGEGAYTFQVDGRSGGWLILDTWDGPSPWHASGRKPELTWDGPEDLRAWLDGLAFPDLRRFYVTVATLDHDLSREACRAEVSYQFSDQRQQWEAGKLEEEAEAALAARECEAALIREIEESRPDMRPA